MRIETCCFCSSDAYPGSVLHFVRNDHKIFKFCRFRCLKAFKNRKNPYKTKWTKKYREPGGNELMPHPTFDFESRRNIPVKYSYELYIKTLEAIERATEIKHRRSDERMLKRIIDQVEVEINDGRKNIQSTGSH